MNELFLDLKVEMMLFWFTLIHIFKKLKLCGHTLPSLVYEIQILFIYF